MNFSFKFRVEWILDVSLVAVTVVAEDVSLDVIFDDYHAIYLSIVVCTTIFLQIVDYEMDKLMHWTTYKKHST